jgi:hypothetical protein
VASQAGGRLLVRWFHASFLPAVCKRVKAAAVHVQILLLLLHSW